MKETKGIGERRREKGEVGKRMGKRKAIDKKRKGK
jgi:hypothetical protein